MHRNVKTYPWVFPVFIERLLALGDTERKMKCSIRLCPALARDFASPSEFVGAKVKRNPLGATEYQILNY
jgi:hypothetical protein